MIDLPSNSGSKPTGTSSPAQGAAAAPASNAKTDSTSSIQLLKQIQQGQTLVAKVQSVKTLSTAEKSLLQQTNPSLAKQLTQQLAQQLSQKPAQQLSQQATKPLNQLTGTLTGALTETLKSNLGANTTRGSTNLAAAINNQLLSKATLYLVKLITSQNSGQTNTLTTVTPEALKANQTVLISKVNQQLVLTKTPAQQLEAIVNQAYKQALPIQQPTSRLQQFVQQLQQLPQNISTQLLGKHMVNTLKSLEVFTYTANKLSSNQQVQQALVNSGIQIENKLVNHQPIQQDIRATLDKLSQILSSTTPLKETNLNPKDLERILAALLPAQSNSSLTTNAPKPTDAATALLFRLLGIPTPQGQLTTDIPKTIQEYIKLLVQQTQAKIQLNQLRSLFADQPINESKTVTAQQFHTEIALRFNEQLLPLQITIKEQDYVEDKNPQDSEENETDDEKPILRRWQVMMSFDLPDGEKLHTQLSIVEESVSATLWAESIYLCEKTRQEINHLRDKLLAKGLTVEELTCLHGKPPEQEILQDYNLIDITT